MTNFNDIKGQETAVKYLRNSLRARRLSGSYLFFGPRGVGRSLCMKAFIMAMVCKEKINDHEACGKCSACIKVLDHNHPDIAWIKPEKNKAIKIEEVRRVKNALSLKPYEAPVSVCVIEDAHMMTVPASNALLKVLEEPPEKALLILVTDKKELLLDTVISRCTEVRFNPLPPAITKEIIRERHPALDEGGVAFLACFSQGSPGRAREMLEEGLNERKDEVLNLLDTIIEEEDPSCLNWENDNKELLLEDLEMLIMLLRDIALAKEGLTDMLLDKDVPGTGAYRFFENAGIDKIYSTVARIIGMKRALLGNVNPKIAAQVLPGMLK